MSYEYLKAACFHYPPLISYMLYFDIFYFFNQNISRKTLVTDINGVSLPAVTIFTMAIRYLKEHLFKSADLFTSGFVTERDVKYVLTVPAIWTENSKMFMREAAVEVL